MKVRVGSVLFEYTGDRAEIEAKGATLGEVLMDVETRHPGLRFRIVDEQDRVREHMNVFVGSRRTKDLGARVAPGEDVHIFQALSGG